MADLAHGGKCLCGALTYSATGLADIWYCHCTQCRALTGHYLAACRTERDKLQVSGALVWAPHSGASQHGRCAQCGSILFWSKRGSNYVSVLPGSLSGSDGIAVRGHMYVGEKGDYYEIDDGLPRFERHPDGGLAS